MSTSVRSLRYLAAVLGLALAASTANAQRVVVSHDDWLTATNYFKLNEQTFVSNTLGWFGAESGSSVLLYTSSSMMTNSSFQNYLTDLGMTVTVNTMPASFTGYNVVFAEGNFLTQNNAGLVSYVQGGGNVMYFGGTGNGGPDNEALYSNPFLNAFGLNFASVYNLLSATNVTTSDFFSQGPFGGSLFTEVGQIYADRGNSISLTAPVAGWTTQLFTESGGQGVFGAAAMNRVSVVPEPSTVALMIGGMLAMIPFARRRKSR